MKYLDYELYERISNSLLLNDDQAENDENMKKAKNDEKEWDKQCHLYLEEFWKLSARFPKNFLKEYNKHLLHDSIVHDIHLERKRQKKQYRYDMHIKLLDYYDDTIEHVITFLDVSCLKTNLLFCHQGDSYWLYNEFLAIDNNRLSFEVRILDNSVLYCEFSKLRYQKVQIDK